MNPSHYLPLLLLATFFAILGVTQGARGVHLGLRVGRLEAERERLSGENRELLCEISALSRPARIADEVGRLNIELVDPVELTRMSAPDAPMPASQPVNRQTARRTPHR